MKQTLALFSLFAMSLLQACTTNATTGRSQFLTMSREEEIQLGNEAQPELTKEYGGQVQDPALRQYVSDIGRKLAAVTEADNPSLPWEFTLLDSDVINAFALPGGKVFLSMGLAKEMTNEAQMAAVLGHEIGHVTAKHTNERFGQQAILVGGATVIGAVIGGAVSDDTTQGAAIGAGAGGTVGGIAALSYSRNQEIEADRLGMRYMEKLNYNPYAAVQVQEILKRESEKSGGAPPEILSTHPASDTRIAELQKRLDKYYQHTVNNPQYQYFEDRFQRQFLSRIALLPIENDARRAAGSTIVWSDPMTWCAHCREAAEHETHMH